IVTEWERAKSVLESGGFLTKTTEVLAVQVPDRPGGLAAILEPIEKNGINIDYMYAFTFGREGKAVMIFRFDNPEQALDVLKSAGVEVLKEM
ncbi:MAG TPA: ACT domain-containing protein, partial [Thermodesulfobacteriota bacterium]|nr:ACT domain-containing protein [Thermodesulfobacteriota bacterium]